jgi:hypothetical protein
MRRPEGGRKYLPTKWSFVILNRMWKGIDERHATSSNTFEFGTPLACSVAMGVCPFNKGP